MGYDMGHGTIGKNTGQSCKIRNSCQPGMHVRQAIQQSSRCHRKSVDFLNMPW